MSVKKITTINGNNTYTYEIGMRPVKNIWLWSNTTPIVKKVFFTNEQDSNFKRDIIRLINNYFNECMAGIILVETFSFDDAHGIITWEGEIGSGGTADGLNITTYRPEEEITPLVLIHEIFHVLGLDEILSTKYFRNIMNRNNLNTNYMLSLNQLNQIVGIGDESNCLHASVLPQGASRFLPYDLVRLNDFL